jgi:hypothetical protein
MSRHGALLRNSRAGVQNHTDSLFLAAQDESGDMFLTVHRHFLSETAVSRTMAVC